MTRPPADASRSDSDWDDSAESSDDASPSSPDSADGASSEGRPRHLVFVVEGPESGVRLDKVIAMRDATLFSRTTAARQIQEGHVTINGEPCKKASQPMKPGDRVVVDIPKPPPPTLTPEDIPLEIVYEDDDLLLVNKPPHMATHPPKTTGTGTLANALAHHIRQLSNFHQDPTRVGIVHRLDRDTSGIILCAKDEWVHRVISRQFQRREIGKAYVAICSGTAELDGFTVDARLARHLKHREQMRVVGPEVTNAPDARDALTEFRVRERIHDSPLGELVVVDCAPKTGRTHQIRVHLSHVGLPIVADEFYHRGHHVPTWAEVGVAPPEDADPPFLRRGHERELPPREQWPVMVRHALHAARLTFFHPRRKEEMTVEAPLPADMQRLLDLAHGRLG